MSDEELMRELLTRGAWPPEMESLVVAGEPLCAELATILDDPICKGSSIVRASRIEDSVRDFIARAAGILHD